jgi:hypothetical protein
MHYVNRGIEKAKENWKPLAYVAGTVTAVTAGYMLWKQYNQATQSSLEFLNDGDYIHLDIIETVEEIPHETTSQDTTTVITNTHETNVEIETVNQLYQQPEIEAEAPVLQETIIEVAPVSQFTSTELRTALQVHLKPLRSYSETVATLDFLATYVATTLESCTSMSNLWTPEERLTDSIRQKFLFGLRHGHKSTLQKLVELRKEDTCVPLQDQLKQAFIPHEKINAQFTKLECTDETTRTRIVTQLTSILNREIMENF